MIIVFKRRGKIQLGKVDSHIKKTYEATYYDLATGTQHWDYVSDFYRVGFPHSATRVKAKDVIQKCDERNCIRASCQYRFLCLTTRTTK